MFWAKSIGLHYTLILEFHGGQCIGPGVKATGLYFWRLKEIIIIPIGVRTIEVIHFTTNVIIPMLRVQLILWNCLCYRIQKKGEPSFFLIQYHRIYLSNILKNRSCSLGHLLSQLRDIQQNRENLYTFSSNQFLIIMFIHYVTLMSYCTLLIPLMFEKIY